jgi:general secretion pathway protein G
MRHVVLRLGVALLTFVIGVSCAISYRAVTLHHINVLLAREAVLRDDLFQMRRLIDQYAVDRGSLPKSLDDLVRAGYLRELPEDAFTGQKDWVVVVGDDPNLSEDLDGIIDVHSASLATSREGTPYKEW